jgi:flagellar hook-length control protein FliK
MIETIRATIEIAARQGATQARIALKPDDLGQISVHLSQSSDGLIARLTADTAAGVQALANGRSELHQSLSSLGLSLLQLDIGSSGQSRAGEREADSGESDGRSAASSAVTALEDGDGVDGVGTAENTASTNGPASGALVDVLA